jgi:ammonia channel protein AmtB
MSYKLTYFYYREVIDLSVISKAIQILDILVPQGFGLAAIGTFILLKIVSVFVPLRVATDQEEIGLDISLHGELAYNSSPLPKLITFLQHLSLKRAR